MSAETTPKPEAKFCPTCGLKVDLDIQLAAALDANAYLQARYDQKKGLLDNILTTICEQWFMAFAKLTMERDAAVDAKREIHETIVAYVDSAAQRSGLISARLRELAATQPDGISYRARAERAEAALRDLTQLAESIALSPAQMDVYSASMFKRWAIEAINKPTFKAALADAPTPEEQP